MDVYGECTTGCLDDPSANNVQPLLKKRLLKVGNVPVPKNPFEWVGQPLTHHCNVLPTKKIVLN
jgi:hypothetical protein